MLASFSRLRLAGFGSEGLRRAACRWQCAVGGGLCDVSDASRVFRRRPKVCKKSFLTLVNKGNNFAGGGNESRTTHREKRVVPFTPEHVYSVVGDVKKYEEFVTWCVGSKIVRGPVKVGSNNGSPMNHVKLEAELAIGFNLMSEKYISHVAMYPNKSIRAISRDTSVFDKLLTEWKFKPGEKPDTCEIQFFIDFKFSNPLYERVSAIFFDEVVKEMVGAFEKRCAYTQKGG